MQTLTEALHDEHDKLWLHVERLATAADIVDRASLSSVQAALEEIYHFLSAQLMPYVSTEEVVLYPVVARVVGDTHATATMAHNHQEIQHLVDELEALRWQVGGGSLPESTQHGLRRVLTSLHALITSHLEVEETLFLPLLEAHVSGEESRELLESFRRIEHTLLQQPMI